MARVMIDDRWLLEDAPGRVKKSLSQARDPMKARVPEKWRTSTYGHGLRWRCRWYQPDRNGHKRQHSKSFAALPDAEAFAAGMEDDVRRGRYHDPRQEMRLFSDVADEWLRGKIDLRESTSDRYQRELNVYINPMWGQTPLRAVTTEAVQEWVSEMLIGRYKSRIHGGRKPRPLSSASIRNIVKIVMGGAMQYAVDHDWITENPIRGVVLPKPKASRILGILSIREVEQIADMAELRTGRHEMATLIRFLAYTGVRIGEATSLSCGDVDLHDMRARVRHTWSDTDGGRVLSPPKNGKPRTIALPPSLRDDLAGLMHGQRKSAFLFRNDDGGALQARNIYNRVWKPAIKACGLSGQGITIHSLRHTYASLAIANGADVKTLQTQLGHSSATITLDTYAALWPDRLDEVETAVDAARMREIEDHSQTRFRHDVLPEMA